MAPTKRVLLLTLLTLLTLLLVAGPIHAGNLSVSETVIDYGTIKEGPPVVKRITLSNIGTEALTVANVKTSCACTKTELRQSRLEPNKSTELVITYNTFKYAGKFDKSITLYTGPEGKDETVVKLTGFVDPIPMGVVELTPRKTDVGILSKGKANPVTIVISNTGDADLTVSRIVSRKFNTTYFDGGKSGDIVIPAGQNRQVNLSLKPEATGRLLDVIMIYSNARNDIGNGYKGVLSGKVD